MESSSWFAVNIIASIMNILSICGSSWIIKTAREKRKEDIENRNFLVNDYVYWMSCCDLLGHIILFIYWLTAALTENSETSWVYDVSIHAPGLCTLFGMILQFALISSSTWSVAISLNLFWLMRGVSQFDLIPDSGWIICSISIQINHCIIWFISIVCTLIPITNYGITSNPDGKYECWIQDDVGEWTMSLYLPVSIYIIFTAAILVWIAFAKCNVVRLTKSLQNSLFAYSLLFVFIWLFPTLGRYAKIITDKQPSGLLALHHILLASIGSGNFIIWTFIYPIREDVRRFTPQRHLIGVSNQQHEQETIRMNTK